MFIFIYILNGIFLVLFLFHNFEENVFIFLYSEGNSVFTETFGPEMFQSAKNMTDTIKDDPNKYVSQLKDCLKEKREMVRKH